MATSVIKQRTYREVHHVRVCTRQFEHKRTSKLYAHFDSKEDGYASRTSKRLYEKRNWY